MTLTVRFPAKENPNKEKALFNWPIVLQHDVKVNYRLISRKFLGMKFFHLSVRLGRWVGRYFIKYIAAQAELRIYIMVIIYTNNCNS